MIISHPSPISHPGVNPGAVLGRNRETGAGVVLLTLGVAIDSGSGLLFNECPTSRCRKMVHPFRWIRGEGCRASGWVGA